MATAEGRYLYFCDRWSVVGCTYLKVRVICVGLWKIERDSKSTRAERVCGFGFCMRGRGARHQSAVYEGSPKVGFLLWGLADCRVPFFFFWTL